MVTVPLGFRTNCLYHELKVFRFLYLFEISFLRYPFDEQNSTVVKVVIGINMLKKKRCGSTWGVSCYSLT